MKEKKHRFLPYLVYLLVATVIVTGVSFSRYVKTDSSAEVASRPAIVDLSLGGDVLNFNPTVTPGEFCDFKFVIKGVTEVNMNYGISAELWYNNLPLKFVLIDNRSVEFDPESPTFDIFQVEAFNLFDENNATANLTIEPGYNEIEYTLFVYWPQTDANGVDWNPADFEGAIDIAALSAIVVQTD